MALIKCPECGREISTEAESCPGCGAKRSASKGGFGIGCLLIILVGLGLLIFLAAVDSSQQPKPEDEASDACFMAQEFVKQRLKAPSTADFSNCINDDGSVPVDKNDDGGWTAAGYVDSQNSFGAKIRSTYVVKLHHVSGDQWQADSVDIE